MNASTSGSERSFSNLTSVDLRQVIYSLSDALDLVGIDDVAHGKRVGIMAAACGQTLGFDVSKTTFLFDLGMLHDIGVSSTRVHGHLVAEFDWKNSQEHCAIGYELLRDFPPLAALADPIRYHHTRWDLLSKNANLDPAMSELANLIFLVDRVDTLAAPFYAGGAILTHTATIRQNIAEHAGSYFSPRLVEAFLTTSASEAFWLQLESRGIQVVLQQNLANGHTFRASMNELEQLALIFARIVDAKSPFTADHSLGVARLACLLATRMGLGQEACDKLRIAGLLHDLGKLRVPDEILDKPGPLDDRERKIINTHSFETYQILNQIKGLNEIAQWAAYHHEEPGGTGYPFHLRGESLPLEARILRVADIFQATVQNRPYRQGMSSDSVLGLMRSMSAKGRVDDDVVEAAASDMQGAMTAACLAG